MRCTKALPCGRGGAPCRKTVVGAGAFDSPSAEVRMRMILREIGRFSCRGVVGAAPYNLILDIFDSLSLDTILQEEGNGYLYEKLGYKRTGKIENINERMDIVYYEKN